MVVDCAQLQIVELADTAGPNVKHLVWKSVINKGCRVTRRGLTNPIREDSTVLRPRSKRRPKQCSIDLPSKRRRLDSPHLGRISKHALGDVADYLQYIDLIAVAYVVDSLKRLQQPVGEESVTMQRGFQCFLIVGGGRQHKPAGSDEAGQNVGCCRTRYSARRETCCKHTTPKTAIFTYVVALTLLVASDVSVWLTLAFPVWVLIVSVLALSKAGLIDLHRDGD